MDTLITLSKMENEEILRKFQTTLSGLSEETFQKNLRIHGYNRLIEKSRFTILKLLWDSFFSPLVALLLIASIISALLGDVKDFIIIFSIVILSGAITFFQHFKANTAAERLKKKVQLAATVIRNGIQKEIPFSHIVPGDIIIITAGDIVPADARILDAKDLSIDESTLTGESFPVQKSAFIPSDTKTLSSLTNFAFAGTHVVTGEATAVVIATGKKTQLGTLSKEIIKPKPQTDFDIGIKHLSVLLIKVILALCLFVFLANALLHHEILESFTFAVALAVGLTPELMPVILTINLSRGALGMEKKGVIVKYLPAIQNLGSMDILCTDKTGTLTEGTVSLTDYYTCDLKKDISVLTNGILASLHKSGVKDPLDRALLAEERTDPISSYKKIDEIPFDFTRKRSSVIVAHSSHHICLITKGAPQKILPLCTTYIEEGKQHALLEKTKNKITQHISSLNQQGLRVILVAKKNIPEKKTYDESDETSLSLVGYLVFHDPVKVTVSKTVQELKDLGIAIKILTGDSEEVTQKVCEDVHIEISGILTGEELAKMTDTQLQQSALSTTIFARLTPEDKARIIEALKKTNHVVGYLGDGVNDAPPLKTADVGISVHNGSDIARDVADIILMQKSLSVLQEGTIEGRKTHGNIFKYILMSLSSNLGNMITVAAASFFLPFLPLLPVQILFIDFLYDLSQITIPTDTVDSETIKKPQQWNISFLKKFMFVFGPISSFFDIATFLGLLFLFHASVPVFRTGWFVESVITQTLIILAIRTKKVPFFKSLPSIPVALSAGAAILVALFFVNSALSSLFSFTTLPSTFYIFLAIIILFYFLAVEGSKALFYRHLFFRS